MEWIVITKRPQNRLLIEEIIMSLAHRIYTRYLAMILFILLIIFSTIPVAGDTQGPGIRVQLVRETRLSLHVTLWSGAKTAIKVSRNRLPWAADESLIVVTAIGNGQCLKGTFLWMTPC
jgi:hypothetical protein